MGFGPVCLMVSQLVQVGSKGIIIVLEPGGFWPGLLHGKSISPN